MSPKRKSTGKKAATTRKRQAAGRKTASSRKAKAAGSKAAKTRTRREAKKAAARASRKPLVTATAPTVPSPELVPTQHRTGSRTNAAEAIDTKHHLVSSNWRSAGSCSSMPP